MRCILRFLAREDGPTAVEYAVMMALILLAAISSISLLGSETGSSFSDSADKISTAFGNAS
jgi:pilus assembly protein Flp/PilA